MLIFGCSPGVVGRVVSGGALPFGVVVGGNGSVPLFGEPAVMKAVLTSFQYSGRSNVVVSHSLRSRIYVYIMGERAGRAEVGGVAFANVCNGDPASGFDRLHAYYEGARASAQGLPVRLLFGPRTTLFGFMSDFEFRLEDPSTGLGLFRFGFHALPRLRLGTFF